jgi:hypothetical protein
VRLASLLVFASACGTQSPNVERPREQAEAAPPRIEATCMASRCTFVNDGGPGQACFVVLCGAATGEVASSAQVCGGEGEHEVRFAEAPPDGCVARAVAPGEAEATAKGWRDELRTSAGLVTDDECHELAGRVVAVLGKRGEGEAVKQQVVGECLTRWTREQAECVRKAEEYRELSRCFTAS